MFSMITFRQLLGYGRVLLLLLIVPACSRDKDIPGPAAVKQVEFKEKLLSVAVGQSAELKVLHYPSELNAPEYEWFVLNPDVARVENGRLRGLSAGETVLAVTAKGLNLTARIKIRVVPVLPQAQTIVLSPANMSLVTGQDHVLEATVLPEQAKDKSVKWNSSNVSVATVDQHGRVVAVGKGTAIIWAISVPNPRVQAACQVMVVNPEDRVFTQTI